MGLKSLLLIFPADSGYKLMGVILMSAGHSPLFILMVSSFYYDLLTT